MNYTERIRELKEERATLANEARQIVEAARGEDRDLTTEEDQRFDRIHQDIDAKGKAVGNLEKQQRVDTALETIEDRAEDRLADVGGDKPASLNDILKRWGRDGKEGLTPEEQRGLKIAKHSKGSVIEIPLTKRAQSVGTDSEGGYTVPEGWQALERATLAYGGVRAAARVIRTASGEKMHIPTVNDTSNVGALIGENTEVDELDVAFSEVELDAYKYTSKAVRVPHELLNDSLYDIAGLLAELLAERTARIQNQHFTTGTGSAQPQGIVIGAADFGTATAATGAVTFAEVVAFKHGIDPSYRSSPSFGFMMNDSTLSALKQISIGTADARPLWQPGVAVGAPDTIDGSPYWINQDMANMGASAKFMLCGDFSNYWIRDVESVRLLRLDERYAEFDQVAFVLFSRHDAVMVNAGTNPVKFLQNAAS